LQYRFGSGHRLPDRRRILMLRYANIVHNSVVDGPGNRSVIFFQGCTLRCPGCQNRHLWPVNEGQTKRVTALAARLLVEARETQMTDAPAITISGGEPFEQADALVELVYRLRRGGAGHIILYTGYTWEELWSQVADLGTVLRVLEQVDILVDGRYDYRRDSAWMQYRGSANQRPIDLKATLASGEVVTFDDWDTPEIIIGPDGSYTGTAPVVALLGSLGLGRAKTARRCGQTGNRANHREPGRCQVQLRNRKGNSSK
ncbi:MAG: 4Fe-4S single cluster domain-containing protein, partial [Anaerolineales bacterium]